MIKKEDLAPINVKEFLDSWDFDFHKEETFDGRWLLEALNSKGPGDWGDFWDVPDGHQWAERIAGFTTHSREYTRRLRDYVALWLATGRSPDGVETPVDRKPTREIHWTVQEFLEKHPATPVLLKDGYSLSILIQLKRHAFGGPGAHLLRTAEDEAQHMFVAMLMSDFRLRIAKCVNLECGTYFFLGQWNRTYKNGTFCEVCKRRRSINCAKEDTARDRTAAESALHSHAARRFAKQISSDEAWYRDGALKTAMAEFLNKQIVKSEQLAAVYPRGVTGKWIARKDNWLAIEEAVSREHKKEGAEA